MIVIYITAIIAIILSCWGIYLTYSLPIIDPEVQKWFDNVDLMDIGTRWEMRDGHGGYGIIKDIVFYNSLWYATVEVYWPDGDYRYEDNWLIKQTGKYRNFFDTFEFKV